MKTEHRMTVLLRSALLVAALLAPAALLGSCNIVGPVAYLVDGPPSINAEYKLEDRPTLVFIDDRDNMVNPVSLRRAIADRASQDLMTRKLVTRTISSQDAMGLVGRHDTSREVMPIDAIGRAVGAEQIIYVEMLAFQDRLADYTPRAIAVCRVRVIDVTNRKRLFPDDESEMTGRVLQITTREFNPDLYQSRAARNQIYESLAQATGDRIAKLFYKHEARELGGTLQAR